VDNTCVPVLDSMFSEHTHKHIWTLTRAQHNESLFRPFRGWSLLVREVVR
jgi:hypothetical protein